MNEALVYQAHYTKSDPILNYMTGMLDFHPHDSILEPCGGDGVFVDKILEKDPKANICVFELNPKAVLVLKDKYRGEENIQIKETDTLLDESITSCSIRFDKIIGNPPYGARNDEKKKGLLNKLYADLYTKESYTLFLYTCTRCLNENGELSFIIPDTFLSLHRHLAIRKYLLTNTIIKELALFPSSFFPGINFGYANLCIITLKKSSNVAQNLRNEISIRTNFKTVDELESDECGTKKTVSQKEVIEGVGSAFMFNSTDKIAELINDDSIQKIGDIANCVTGFYSGNDKDYLHPISPEIKNAKKYICANSESIHTSFLTDKEKACGIDTADCLVPVVKGGNIEYVKPNYWFMDWSTKAINKVLELIGLKDKANEKPFNSNWDGKSLTGSSSGLRNIIDDINLEETIDREVKMIPENFGRVAILSAKQIVVQKIKEAEKNMVNDEFKDKLIEVLRIQAMGEAEA